MTRSYTIANAEERNKQAPDTFPIPSPALRRGLQVGDFAKIIFELEPRPPPDEPIGERLWIQLTKVENGRYTGKVNNNPFFMGDLIKFDQEVSFGPEHVADVMGRNE